MFTTRALTSSTGSVARRRHISWTAPLAVIVVGMAVIVPAVRADAATATVGLGTAATYSVLGGQTVTNTGPSTLSGDLGVDPGSADPGFPPGLVGGATHLADAVALQAQSDLTTAYTDAAGRTPTANVASDLVGKTLTSGVYRSPTLSLSGSVTLNGPGVYIFQAGSTLITASSSTMLLTNGANACDVFWQVGSSATLGTTSKFVGTIMALTSITVNTSVAVNGRALARNAAVTLDDDTFTGPTCAASGGTTTTTTPGTAKASAKTASPTGTSGTGTSGTGTNGTGSPTGTLATGTLPTTGINPLLPILGGSMTGFGLILLGLSSARRRRTSP